MIYFRKPYVRIAEGQFKGDAFVTLWDVHLMSDVNDVVKPGQDNIPEGERKRVRMVKGTFRRFLRFDCWFFILIFKWNYVKEMEEVKKGGLAGVVDRVKAQQKKKR